MPAEVLGEELPQNAFDLLHTQSTDSVRVLAGYCSKIIFKDICYANTDNLD